MKRENEQQEKKYKKTRRKVVGKLIRSSGIDAPPSLYTRRSICTKNYSTKTKDN